MNELLEQFVNPETIHALSATDKLLAGLFTTVLGISITFLALIILQCIISWMNRFINVREPTSSSDTAPQIPPKQETKTAPVPETVKGVNNEIVAAITAAIGMMPGLSSDRIVIERIVKVRDRVSVWHQTGIIEQMNSRF